MMGRERAPGLVLGEGEASVRSARVLGECGRLLPTARTQGREDAGLKVTELSVTGNPFFNVWREVDGAWT